VLVYVSTVWSTGWLYTCSCSHSMTSTWTSVLLVYTLVGIGILWRSPYANRCLQKWTTSVYVHGQEYILVMVYLHGYHRSPCTCITYAIDSTPVWSTGWLYTCSCSHSMTSHWHYGRCTGTMTQWVYMLVDPMRTGTLSMM